MLRGVRQPEEFLGMENRRSDHDREQTQTQPQNHSQPQQQTGFGRAGVAAAYARSFATLCAGPTETLLDNLGDGSGGKLLDAGCGVGGFSRAAAGRGWAVTAVDASAEMIAATRAAVRGLPVEVQSGSVLDLPFPDGHFDAAVANFVINHVPDPRLGVREIARVLRPGGEVGLTIWTNQRTAQIELFSGSLENAGAVLAPGHRLPEEKDFERSVAGLAGIVQEAGLQPLVSREIRWTWDVRWEDLWAAVTGGIATIGAAYLRQDQATQNRIESGMRSLSAQFETDGLIRLPSVAAYVLAHKPQ